MFYILYVYWFVLTLLVIGVTVLAIKQRPVASVIGRLGGKLRKNNNWLWSAFVVVGVLLTINAFLAGRGAPVLTTSAKEVERAVKEEISKHPGAVQEFKRFLYGTNLVTLPTPPATTATVEKRYHSWWHLIIAVAWWLWVAVDYLISRRDDIARALRKSRRHHAITNNPPVGGPAPTGNVSTEGIMGWIRRVFQEKGFTFHSFIEVLWEVIVPKMLGKWWGRN